MANGLYFIIALLAGVAVALQLGVNAQLRQAVAHPAVSALISFLVGTVALSLYVGGTARHALPPLDTLRHLAWYKWTGGLLGAVYVTTAIVVGPRLGAANFVSSVVAGQLLAAVVFDHFGLLGFAVHPAGPYRLLGALLLVAGVYLIQRN